MTGIGVAVRVADILDGLSQNLQDLQSVGGDIPAVERNAVRMRGTLRALQVQFEDLVRSVEREG